MFAPIFKALLLIALYSHLSGASLAALSQISRLQTGGAGAYENAHLNQIMLRMNKLQHKVERELLGISALQSQLVQLEIRIAALQSDFRKKNLMAKTSTSAEMSRSDVSAPSPISDNQQSERLTQDTNPPQPKMIHPLVDQVWTFFSISGLFLTVGMILIVVLLFFIFRRSQKSSHHVDVSIGSKRGINRLFMDAKRLVNQGHAAQAIELLETQLIAGNRSVILWKLLFEILQSQGMKVEFRKLALRFKRLGKHKNMWLVIQKLGHQLEPDNLLYFSEKKRRETFFNLKSSVG